MSLYRTHVEEGDSNEDYGEFSLEELAHAVLTYEDGDGEIIRVPLCDDEECDRPQCNQDDE